ncbi:MAG: glycosyltransferase [Oscillospiraceae bacterium]
MNDRTAYRVGEVLTRTKRLRRQRERHLLEGLSALCLLLTVGLAVAFGGVMRGLPPDTLEAVTFATMLLHEGAGGYVLVGVLALVAGVMITMVCLWRHKKH